jgi:hypothetical protein
MRLLKCNSAGEISLTTYFIKDIPPYAVLSHAWDAEEVTFQDLVNGTGQNKAGYSKIRFCASQAWRDGLQFFWVDTCCIDKSSSVELAEAVNSMFRWFHDAVVCYVYLADVSTLTFNDRRQWESTFRRSRWFTRGWTLQELLAPEIVYFFDCDGQRLGSKSSLLQPIHEITGIPILALQGKRLSEFSVDERMSWLNGRETTRGEDRAYSVMGIFGVHMSLIYGEGEDNAFRRLLEEIAKCATIRPEKDLESTIDMESESCSTLGDVASIFSESALSMSSKSSVGMSPAQVSGIREVARALLSREDFKSLCTAAVTNVTPRKSRVHIRGFLKNYGQQLNEEASSVLQYQAARFVQEVAGRVADEIRWSITGFDKENKPTDAEIEKQNLEKWHSTIENGLSQAIPKSNDPDQLISDDDESDDEPDITTAFPNIDSIRGFLLSSNAFEALLQALENWMKINKGPVLHAKERDISVPEVGKTMDFDEAAQGSEVPHADAPASAAFERHLPHLPGEPMSKSSRTELPSRPKSRPESVQALISGLLDFWGISFFVYDLFELLVPPVPIGFERIRWRCVSLWATPQYITGKKEQKG